MVGPVKFDHVLEDEPAYRRVADWSLLVRLLYVSIKKALSPSRIAKYTVRSIDQWSYMRYVGPLIIDFHYRLQGQGTSLILMHDNALATQQNTSYLLRTNGVPISY